MIRQGFCILVFMSSFFDHIHKLAARIDAFRLVSIKIMKKYLYFAVFSTLVLLSACSAAVSARSSQVPELILDPTRTPSPTPILTKAPTLTPTTTQTAAPNRTFTPLPSVTPTITLTPTPTKPFVLVQQLAHCRYGPGTAYLHSHDLHPGDTGVVDGKNASGSWLWIQPAGLDRHCWVALSVVKVQGDVSELLVVSSKLPYSNLYGPPQDVQAERDGPEVTISWSPIGFTEDDDRGYMLQLTLCTNGQLEMQTIQTFDTSVTVIDENGCGGASSGILWGVEKHGYTQPVEIPWPDE